MTISDSEIRLPFDDLIAELKRCHFKVGVEQRLRLFRLLDKIEGHCQPEQLKTLLCPIFATDEKEQADFYRIFESLYPLFRAPPSNRGEEFAQHRHERKTGWRVRYLLAILVGFAVATAFLVTQFYIQRPKPNGSHHADSNPPGNVTVSPAAEGGMPSTFSQLPQTGVLPKATVTAPFSESLTKYRNEFHWAALLIPCLGFLTWETIRRRRRNPVLERTRTVGPPFTWQLEVQLPPLSIYDSRQLFDVARKLRRRQVGEIQRFDIALTVSSTLQALGYPRFRFRPETRFPEYLVLIERASPGDHQAAQFDKLSRALEQEHLFITRFFFESDPRYCWSDSDPARFSLVELQKRFPAHRLLIFSGAEILLDPVSGELASWTTTLFEWSERAVLTAAASSEWGFAERKVAAQFVVLPATLDGLDRLAERFDPDLRRELGRNITPAIEERPEYDGEVQIADLRRYLGEPVFQWLCACAVYPEVRWELTVYLGALPAIGENLVTELNLLKLIQLPWFRAGSIPDPVRLSLIASLDAAKEHAAREAIVELLQRSAAPHRDSYAYQDWDFTFLSQKALRHRKQPRRLKSILREIPRAEIARDYVLLRLLENTRASKLSLILPGFLRRLAFENAVPLFGLSTVMRALITLAVIGIAWWSVDRFTTSPPPPTSTVKPSPTSTARPSPILTLKASPVPTLKPSPRPTAKPSPVPSLLAGQKSVTIATVNFPSIIELKKLSTKFEADNPDIKLNWVVLEEYILRQRVVTDVSTGSGQFDVIFIGMYETPIFAKRGWLKEMGSIPADYDIDDVFKSIRDGLSYQGKLYALPFNGESSMLMYRKDLFEEKGLTMPAQPRYDDIRKFADALTDKSKGIYGITLRGKPGWGQNMAYLGTLINTFGGIWFDMQWHPTIDTPPWKKAISFYVDLMKADGPPDAIANGFNENLTLFAGGKAAMWIDATSAGGVLEDSSQSQVAGKVGYAPSPIEVTPNGSHWLWSWAFAIPKAAKQVEAAEKFALWATSKDYIKLVAEDLGWAAVPPGTRKSTYAIPEIQEAPFATVTLQAMLSADPTNPAIKPVPYTGIQFVGIPEFQSFGSVVGQNIAGALAGKMSVNQALKDSQAAVARATKQAGYAK